MVYQHEIEEKEGFKWHTFFNLFKLLKLFQNYNPCHKCNYLVRDNTSKTWFHM